MNKLRKILLAITMTTVIFLGNMVNVIADDAPPEIIPISAPIIICICDDTCSCDI